MCERWNRFSRLIESVVQVMVPDPVSDNGQDGEPSRPGNGLPSDSGPDLNDQVWNGQAEVERLIAAVDAGQVKIPEESSPGVWFSLAGVADEAELNLAGLGKGGRIDTRPPDAALAALADMACDPAMLVTLGDNQVLGLAAAGRRLAARAAWIQQTAVAEFAARRLEPNPKKATALGFTDFAPDELVPELVIPTTDAELAMAEARDAVRRLPACTGLLHDGRISAFQLKIITQSTQPLSDAGAAEADLLLAAAAPDLTPGKLRAMCTRIVMMIDPAAAQRRKESAAKQARVERFQEYTGNAALSGRELPPDEVLASSQHIDGCARTLRKSGVAGTLQELRARVFLDLTQGRDPLDRIAGVDGNADAGARDSRENSPAAGQPDNRGPNGSRPLDHRALDETPDDESPDDETPDDMPDDGSTIGARPGGSPSRAKPPVKATITLLVPVGTALGWSSAPGEIPGFGLLDPQTTRDMMQAASAHPETRWCVTLVGPDGTAAAHGCAPGRHPWIPRNGPGPPAPDAPGPAEQAAQVTALLRRLRVQLAPIAKGTCDHRHYSDRYVISRTLKHLIKARAAKCTAPGCNRPAAEADADHTIPWPAGPSCECNLGAPCRYHHRNKQAPGWLLEQPEPGVMKWHTPSGRTCTTYPTRYLI
jgi:hypothetical protein